MILLTGASGYLGRHVSDRLRRGDVGFADVGGPQAERGCDLTNPDHVTILMRDYRPTTILHCAARVPKTLEEYEDAVAAADSARMVRLVVNRATGVRIVFASTMSVFAETAYAAGKRKAERELRRSDVILRLPGLFGAERLNGRIYTHAKDGSDYGTYPAMHVEDAAEYLVRAATMPSDGKPEPFSVVYGHPRLVATYGDIPHTFQSRVQALVEQVRGL